MIGSKSFLVRMNICLCNRNLGTETWYVLDRRSGLDVFKIKLRNAFFNSSEVVDSLLPVRKPDYFFISFDKLLVHCPLCLLTIIIARPN